jgi:hypothetical protein
MDRPNNYFIGDLGFRTQKDAVTYTRDVITSIGCGEIRNDHARFSFFCKLINNHSNSFEKIGYGIDYFEICENKLNSKRYHMNIIRLDGSSIDFSWNDCAKKTSNDVRKKLKDAMREYVNVDIFEFRKAHELICQICGIDDGEFHVDHNDPPFIQLHDSFLKTNKLPIPILFDNNEFYQVKFKNDDLQFAENWLKYHKENATLQILCKLCNLKKSNK